MGDILNLIAYKTKIRVEKSKELLPLAKLKELLFDSACLPDNLSRESYAFENALKKPGISFICEVKKASPSNGVIDPVFSYVQIAMEYEEAGADAVSVLTEPCYFMGNSEHLYNIRKKISLPILRKDFILDEYQIYEAKHLGADAILLICALLDEEKIKAFITVCDILGLSALVETHREEEIKIAVRAGARIIGVNNRNLKTFRVDVTNCVRLRKAVPKGICFVAESGIRAHDDILRLQEAGVDAVLIGECLMRSKNKKQTLLSLKGGSA